MGSCRRLRTLLPIWRMANPASLDGSPPAEWCPCPADVRQYRHLRHARRRCDLRRWRSVAADQPAGRAARHGRRHAGHPRLGVSHIPPRSPVRQQTTDRAAEAYVRPFDQQNPDRLPRFSLLFIKSFSVLSVGFEIETGISIRALKRPCPEPRWRPPISTGRRDRDRDCRPMPPAGAPCGPSRALRNIWYGLSSRSFERREIHS